VRPDGSERDTMIWSLFATDYNASVASHARSQHSTRHDDILWSYALPFLPVLLDRAPPIFWIAPSVYVLLSFAVLERLRRMA
jgi:hypothetical protein